MPNEEQFEHFRVRLTGNGEFQSGVGVRMTPEEVAALPQPKYLTDPDYGRKAIEERFSRIDKEGGFGPHRDVVLRIFDRIDQTGLDASGISISRGEMGLSEGQKLKGKVMYFFNQHLNPKASARNTDPTSKSPMYVFATDASHVEQAYYADMDHIKGILNDPSTDLAGKKKALLPYLESSDGSFKAYQAAGIETETYKAARKAAWEAEQAAHRDSSKYQFTRESYRGANTTLADIKLGPDNTAEMKFTFAGKDVKTETFYLDKDVYASIGRMQKAVDPKFAREVRLSFIPFENARASQHIAGRDNYHIERAAFEQANIPKALLGGDAATILTPEERQAGSKVRPDVRIYQSYRTGGPSTVVPNEAGDTVQIISRKGLDRLAVLTENNSPTIGHRALSHVPEHLREKVGHMAGSSHVRGGVLGLVGAGGAAAMEAHKGVGAAINAASEAVLPGSTTAGHDICKVTGTVVGGVGGTLAAAGTGALTLTTLTPTASPLVSVPATVVAGGAAFSVTQPVVKQGTEALCNAVLPDSVKRAAGKALAALDSALTFGGSDKIAQNAHSTADKGPRAK